MYDPSTQYCSFIYMTLVILDLQAACSTQHMVFWIKRMTCFFSPTFFLFSRFPQTLCCNLKPLKRRWTSFILPRHLHHQKAPILLLYQVPTSFNHQCDRMPWLTSRSNASMNIRGAAAKLTGCFFVVTLMTRGGICWRLLSWENVGRRRLPLRSTLWGWTWAVRWPGCGVKAADEHPLCDSSLPGRLFCEILRVRFFFFQCFSVNFKRQWLWLWIVFFLSEWLFMSE